MDKPTTPTLVSPEAEDKAKALYEAGRIGEAQGIILSEIERWHDELRRDQDDTCAECKTSAGYHHRMSCSRGPGVVGGDVRELLREAASTSRSLAKR